MTRERQVSARIARVAALLILVAMTLPAEVRRMAGAGALKQQLERLRVVGSVLLIAAHPDDENTALLAWCAQERQLRTGYLSLTRGEGGQNLIGSEQGDLLGVIRTQELLAARRLEGDEQFFTRAIDFGFSKTAAETMEKWGKQEVLGDVVWVIRRYRPDVVILRFSGTTRDGHGHHQASSLLGQEAFKLAADEKAFPEQLKWVKPWQAKRLLWNGFSFTREQEKEMEGAPKRLVVDTGAYNPVLGLSYGELAGLSRSQHRSQGMGAAERRGSAPNYLLHYAGVPARTDFLDDVDTKWTRFAGGAAVQALVDEAAAQFRMDAPEAVIPTLLKARRLMAAIDDETAKRKVAELDEAIALAGGLFLEIGAGQAETTPGGKVELALTAVRRGRTAMKLEEASAGPVRFAAQELEFNVAHTARGAWQVPAEQELTRPIQLRAAKKGNLYGISRLEEIGPAEAAPVLEARFVIAVGGERIELKRAVEYHFVDRVKGESTRPLVVVPAVSVRVVEPTVVLTDDKAKTVTVEVRGNVAGAAGEAWLEAPAGWKVAPAKRPYQLTEAGQVATLSFEVSAAGGQAELRAVATAGGRRSESSLVQLNYDHIPFQTIQPPAVAHAVRADVKVLAKRIGYVMGAGDEVPAALKQMGCEVTLLEANDLASGDLTKYDAIVAGVRAFNVRADLRASHLRLREYMEKGGTFVVQYNVLEGFPGMAADNSPLKNIGPYPIRLSRDRTTVEEAAVSFVKPDHRLLQMPNRITAADFEGWIQERAIYFPGEWAAEYEPVLECHDPGEAAQKGGLLYAKVGKGAYVFTSYVFFRELPAGVGGAYRLFANLISAGR